MGKHRSSALSGPLPKRKGEKGRKEGKKEGRKEGKKERGRKERKMNR